MVYLDVPLVKNLTAPKAGLGTRHGDQHAQYRKAGEWYDPWGAPYIVAIDANYNGYVRFDYKSDECSCWDIRGERAITLHPAGTSGNALQTRMRAPGVSDWMAVQGSATSPKSFTSSDDVLSWE